MIVTRKSWGHEELVHNGDYCCKLLVYAKPIASSLHYHEKKHETFVVATGEFHVRVFPWVGGVSEMVRRLVPGDHLVLPPGTRHRITCIKPGTIVEASTHDDPEDCIRLIPSE